MKICVTGLRGIPGVIGGVETHCEELLPRIAQIDPEIEIDVCCRARYVDPEMASFRRVRLTALYSPPGNTSEAFGSTAMAIVHAWRQGADAIHIHAVGPALLSPLARLLGLGVLLTHHGADYNRAKWGFLAKSMLKLGERLGMLYANRIICVSPSLASEMRDRYPTAAGKVVFIPNGVDPPDPPDEPAEDILARLGCEPGNYVLCVARLVPEKGIDYLIEAHRNSGDNRQLVIAGAGRKGDRHAEELMTQARGKVRMLGMQPRDVLGVLYRHASLFVLPSFHEGLPIAALEALSCGCPVLLSDIQPNLDLGLPPQCYFPVGDVAALSQRLAGGQVPGGDGASARLSLMSWDEVAARTAPYYREMAGRARFTPELRNAG